jgi:hypothetical protein
VEPKNYFGRQCLVCASHSSVLLCVCGYLLRCSSLASSSTAPRQALCLARTFLTVPPRCQANAPVCCRSWSSAEQGSSREGSAGSTSGLSLRPDRWEEGKERLEEAGLTWRGRVGQMRWVESCFPFTEPSLELEVFFNGDWLEVALPPSLPLLHLHSVSAFALLSLAPPSRTWQPVQLVADS